MHDACGWSPSIQKLCKIPMILKKFGVMRVVNAKICFAKSSGEFSLLCSDTYSTDDREACYKKARGMSALMVELPKSGFVPRLPQDRTQKQQSQQSPIESVEQLPTGEPPRPVRRLDLIRELRLQLAGVRA